jgi:hypothetical protein
LVSAWAWISPKVSPSEIVDFVEAAADQLKKVTGSK